MGRIWGLSRRILKISLGFVKSSSYRSCTPFGWSTISKGLEKVSHTFSPQKIVFAKPSPHLNSASFSVPEQYTFRTWRCSRFYEMITSFLTLKEKSDPRHTIPIPKKRKLESRQTKKNGTVARRGWCDTAEAEGQPSGLSWSGCWVVAEWR
jgi:hypothetical protein